MAVCGLLSMRCVSPIQPDMDSCPGHSSGVTRNHLKFWQSGVGPRASSCLSSTMVDHNDPDDSGSSQPPTPTRTLSESNPHVVIRDSSLPRHELDLSISLNDAHRNTPSPRLKSIVKDEFDLTSASTAREDTLGLGRSAGGLEEEASFSGPPRKRARVSPLRFRLEENQAGNVREQLQLQRPSLVSTSSAVTGMHRLMPSRSLPSFRSTEREPSPSQSRGASSGSRPPTSSWWLGPGPINSAMIPSEAQHFQSLQEQPTRANFGIDGRGMIPGTSLQQERDFSFKEPSFYPNMLSSMETSEQVRRGEDAPSPAGARPQEQAGRPQTLQDPAEHPFFSRKESSMSRVSGTSTVSEETVPRPGSTFFGKNREAPFQDASTFYGQQNQQSSFEVQGGRRRHPTASESQQHVDLEREHPQRSFAKQVEQRTLPQGDQRALLGSPGGNANTTFYARIMDAAQQPISSPFSEPGGYGDAHNPSLNLVGQSSLQAPRASSIQFGGAEAPNSNLMQAANSDALRNLLAAHPSIGSVPPFMPQGQNPDPIRLSFPNLSSLDFLQSLQQQQQQQQQQRQSFLPQGTDRYRLSAQGGHVGASHPTPQGLPFLGAPEGEVNPSLPPRGGQPGNLQPSQGLRDFLSSQGPKGPSPLGLGRGPAPGPRLKPGPHGFGSLGLEIPTHLSLQAPVVSLPLTVVMEGRSIGRRISLQDYDGYDSFAAAMRAMVNSHVSSQEPPADGGNCTLMTAIPGYVIAYEDEEGDVLLAGDVPWRDFVRMAKQIRIVSSSRISFRLPSGRGEVMNNKKLRVLSDFLVHTLNPGQGPLDSAGSCIRNGIRDRI